MVIGHSGWSEMRIGSGWGDQGQPWRFPSEMRYASIMSRPPILHRKELFIRDWPELSLFASSLNRLGSHLVLIRRVKQYKINSFRHVEFLDRAKSNTDYNPYQSNSQFVLNLNTKNKLSFNSKISRQLYFWRRHTTTIFIWSIVFLRGLK